MSGLFVSGSRCLPYNRYLCAEVIEQDILRWHSEAVKKVDNRLGHHWRSTHKVDDALWLGVVLEICLVENVVYKAWNIRNTSLISLWIGTIQSEVELEVRELLLDLVVVVEVEGLLERTSTVEEVNLATRLKSLEEVHNV